MSVPRRLGAGHSSEVDSGATLALQPRHPAGFPSEKVDEETSSSVHAHSYTEQLSSSSSTHISGRSLQPLSLGQTYSPSGQFSSPQTSLSIASTISSPSTPTGQLASPGAEFCSPAGAGSTNPLAVISGGSSTSSSPGGSPLLARRNAARPAQTGNGGALKFASPFRSMKPASSASPSSCSPTNLNETINSIMQEDSATPAAPSSLPNKSPGADSPRALYSPKPSPGVRPNVASPAPVNSSAVAVSSYNNLPAIDRVHRYVVTGTLQQSLFGVVKLAFDRVLRQQVAIKISRRERAQQQQTRSGVSVLENVRREAAVMQYLHERSASGHLNKALGMERRKSLYGEMFAQMMALHDSPHKQNCSGPSLNGYACGGGGGAMAGRRQKRMSSRATTHTRVNDERMADDESAHSTPISALQPTECDDQEDSDMAMHVATPSSISSRISALTSTPPSSYSPSASSSVYASPSSQPFPIGPLDATDQEGERYICKYVEELEDEHFHYLVTDFIPAGDLYSMLTSFPQHRLSEAQARGLFRQMVLGVKYLHLRNVAHLDMSLENMCLDMDDAVRIIDFGVAALHPFTPTSFHTSYFSYPSASSPISFPQSTASSAQSGGNSVASPLSSSSRAGVVPHVPAPHRAFLCKPVKELYAKPGKIRYMSPELFQGVAWDAYANDVFSLGVILYSLLTGRPPFQQAESSDVWFHVIYSGQWLTPQIRKQPSAHVYTHLSDQALDLINFVLKPQEIRPTCEQILQHPWMMMQAD